MRKAPDMSKIPQVIAMPGILFKIYGNRKRSNRDAGIK